jgi:hypothetical protein
MKLRPTSVTVVGWILIATGGISLLTIPFSLKSLNDPAARALLEQSPLPISIQYILVFVGVLTTMTCGIAALKGQNWARFVYVIWNIIGFAVGFATSPVKLLLIPGLVIVSICAFFLFRPKANAYFAEANGTSVAQSI